MNEGVEWAMHSCVNLSWLPGEAVTAKRLAAFYDLPTAYLNKQLQALTRAGILTSVSGPKGGFQLARDPRQHHAARHRRRDRRAGGRVPLHRRS